MENNLRAKVYIACTPSLRVHRAHEGEYIFLLLTTNQFATTTLCVPQQHNARGYYIIFFTLAAHHLTKQYMLNR